jgi:hypothetical protein
MWLKAYVQQSLRTSFCPLLLLCLFLPFVLLHSPQQGQLTV